MEPSRNGRFFSVWENDRITPVMNDRKKWMRNFMLIMVGMLVLAMILSMFRF